MKSLFFILSFLVLFQFSFAIDIPPGGTDMIADAITNYSRVGSQGTVSVVNVENEDFSKAIRVNVTSLPANYYNFQVQFKTVAAIEKGDICLLSLWARCTYSQSEAGEGLFTPIIENNTTYEKPLSKTFEAGAEWIHFVYPFVSDMDLSLDKIRAAIFFGYAVQTIEIADIHYWNYKKTINIDSLPQMEVRYNGMELDAQWRTEAAERIEKFRKGNVNVKLVDASDNPVSGAAVNFTMKQHKFGFGSAVNANTYNNNSVYRNHVNELFNEVVFENDLKWKSWVANTNHTYITTAINTLASHGIRIRGHNLIWPGWSYLPSFMETYKNDGERLKSECINHIQEIATFTKGKVVDWDVINEPYTNHVIQDVVGDEVMADWFKKTKEVDPDVKRYINDYSILSNGGADVGHQNGYFDIIKYIDDQGGEIQGIGLQGHFSEFVTGIPKVIEVLDRFASLNKEIKVTEFDINSTNDTLKSNYTRDFMTVLFSYPYVKGILSWGFWAGQHWKPEAAYYDVDWTIRLQGEMYKKLVFEDWWTKTQNSVSDAQGDVDFGSCFLGTYDFEVQYDGKTITKSVNIDFNKENEVVINVDDETVSITGSVNEGTPVFTSVDNINRNKSAELLVYPNPASSMLNIDLNGLNSVNGKIEIINATGNCFYSEHVFSESATINLPVNISPGLYFLSFQD